MEVIRTLHIFILLFFRAERKRHDMNFPGQPGVYSEMKMWMARRRTGANEIIIIIIQDYWLQNRLRLLLLLLVLLWWPTYTLCVRFIHMWIVDGIIYGAETLMKVQIARIKLSYKRRENAFIRWDACADFNMLRYDGQYVACPIPGLIVLYLVRLIESGNRAPRPQYF